MIQRAACLLILLGVAGLAPGMPLRSAEAASWRDLTGRVAPDLVFAEAAQGLDPGSRLSSFRSRQVVLLVFWLRDCPHCKRELPKVQRMHEMWGRSGLTVISVIHKYPLSQVTPIMASRGWTFPVVRDPTGAMASRYGGGRRPGYYVVGIDGRVKASNVLSERVLGTELSRWRLHEIGPLPAELAAARDRVAAGDYGAALRAAEAESRKATASAAVRAGTARLQQIAGRKLQNRVDRAETWYRQGQAQRAAQEYRGILATFTGTSLQGRAQTLHDQFMARLRGR